MQEARNLIDRTSINRRNYCLRGNISEQSDLMTLIFRNRSVGTTKQDVRLNTNLTQFFYGVLCWFSFKFASCRYPRQQGQMDITRIVAPFFKAHLANCFQERKRFNIADCTTHFNDCNFSAFSATLHMIFNFIGNMWNNLNSFTKIFAATFFLDHGFINLTSSEVITLAHARANKTLVMT